MKYSNSDNSSKLFYCLVYVYFSISSVLPISLTQNGDLTSVSNVMDAGLLQGMSNFFDMYEKHAEKLDSQLMELTTELKDLDLQMENLEHEVKGLSGVKEEKRKR